VTQPTTPTITSKKDYFRSDEDPGFIVEYPDEEELFGLGATAAAQAAPVTVDAVVYDASGKRTDIKPKIDRIEENKFAITVPRERAFRAGVYTLAVELVKDERVYVEEQEFPWGLVSLNTRKSIYKPGETAEFIIVVLDHEGHPVCGANLSLTVTTPNNKATIYSTDEGTITSGAECGIHHATYTTALEGNHTINITAAILGTDVSFTTHFLVQQNYEFDILRTAQSKIDPTKQDWFEVTINIVSFTDAEFLTIKEFVPAKFDISTTDAVTILGEDDTKIITWEKELSNNKSSVCYSYAVPHIWPYLYALGPVEIDYNSKTFEEARPWYVAVDPVLDYSAGSGTDKWAYYGTDTDGNPPPITAGTEFGTYENITASDDDRYSTGGGAANQDPYHRFEFFISGDPTTITQLDYYWEGYNDESGTTSNLYIYNFTLTQWELLGSDTNWATDGIVSGTITDTNEIQSCINASGFLDLVTLDVSNSGDTLYTDYVYVNITDSTKPSWHDMGQNVSKLHKGESINLSTRWTDTGGLKNATLAHNGTGTWQNVSTIALSGTEDWSNFTLVTGADWTPGIKGWKAYANDTSNNDNVTDVLTFELWGYSNVTWISPPDGNGYEVGETVTLTCLIRDANTSAPIENYPVHFYNRTDSTVTHDFGVSYTNSSGYAVMIWDTTGVALGWYFPKGNITDNATLFSNISTLYEANTSVHLYSTTLEIRNQTAASSITSINFSGISGETVSNPYDNVDGSGSPQNITNTIPVATIYNPSSSTNYKIWLKVTNGTGWDNIISNETFNVTADDTSPGAVSGWTSLKPGGSWSEIVDTGETVAAESFKDLYLAFYLKGSGTGNSTLSVLGEVV